MSTDDPLSGSERFELEGLRKVVGHMEEVWNSARQETLSDVIEELNKISSKSATAMFTVSECVRIVQSMK